MIMYNSPLNDSIINLKRRNTKDKLSKEESIGLVKSKTNKRNLNSMSKIQSNNNCKSKKSKIFEKRNTSRFLNRNLRFNEKPKKDHVNTIKREKSADHLKKKSLSLRERIKNYFSEINNNDINNNQNNKNGKIIIQYIKKWKNFVKIF